MPEDLDAGTPWIPDPVERDALRKDLEWALEQDAKLLAHHFGTPVVLDSMNWKPVEHLFSFTQSVNQVVPGAKPVPPEFFQKKWIQPPLFPDPA